MTDHFVFCFDANKPKLTLLKMSLPYIVQLFDYSFLYNIIIWLFLLVFFFVYEIYVTSIISKFFEIKCSRNIIIFWNYCRCNICIGWNIFTNTNILFIHTEKIIFSKTSSYKTKKFHCFGDKNKFIVSLKGTVNRHIYLHFDTFSNNSKSYFYQCVYYCFLLISYLLTQQESINDLNLIQTWNVTFHSESKIICKLCKPLTNWRLMLQLLSNTVPWHDDTMTSC